MRPSSGVEAAPELVAEREAVDSGPPRRAACGVTSTPGSGESGGTRPASSRGPRVAGGWGRQPAWPFGHRSGGGSPPRLRPPHAGRHAVPTAARIRPRAAPPPRRRAGGRFRRRTSVTRYCPEERLQRACRSCRAFDDDMKMILQRQALLDARRPRRSSVTGAGGRFCPWRVGRSSRPRGAGVGLGLLASVTRLLFRGRKPLLEDQSYCGRRALRKEVPAESHHADEEDLRPYVAELDGRASTGLSPEP